MNVNELVDTFNFTLAGDWQLGNNPHSGLCFNLASFSSDRVLYAFCENDVVRYIGICESLKTTLRIRMKRYENTVGGSTNKRITEKIKSSLISGNSIKIYAFKPDNINYHGLDVDLVRGLEYPLINLLGADKWNVNGRKKENTK